MPAALSEREIAAHTETDCSLLDSIESSTSHQAFSIWQIPNSPTSFNEVSISSPVSAMICCPM